MQRPASVVVTGATGAIGRQIALSLSAPGRTVVIHGHRQAEALHRLSEQVRQAGAQPVERLADLADLEAVDRLAADIVRTVGAPDCFIHAAGTSQFALLQDLPLSEWRNLVDLNLGAAARLAGAFLPGMVRQEFGRIVFVGSVYGMRLGAMEAAYAAAKSGLHGLARALTGEAVRGPVTINVVAPGAIDTPMLGRLGPAERSALTDRIPVGRLGTPADVARAVRFLVSPEAAYVTGSCLPVDGGFVL